VNAWIATACEPSVTRRALKVATIVGSLLALINHGDALLAGTVTWQRWVQIGLTFLVPYCVSTFASVEAIRQLPARDGKTAASAPVRHEHDTD
jgi:hypothetical protein